MKIEYKTISLSNEKEYNKLINGGWVVINTYPFNNKIQLMKK